MALFLALACGVGGIGLLYLSWTGRLTPKALAIPAGWAMVCGSAVFWVGFGGAEFGISWCLIAVAFIAWTYAALGRERRRPEERRYQARTTGGRPSRRDVAGWLARLLVVALLTGAAGILSSVATTMFLPWDTGDRYVSVLLGAPVLWGALAVWVGTTSRLPQAAGVLAGVSAVCALVLFL